MLEKSSWSHIKIMQVHFRIKAYHFMYSLSEITKKKKKSETEIITSDLQTPYIVFYLIKKKMRMSTKILFSLGAHINRYSYYNNSKCTAILMCQNPLPSIYISKKKKRKENLLKQLLLYPYLPNEVTSMEIKGLT